MQNPARWERDNLALACYQKWLSQGESDMRTILLVFGIVVMPLAAEAQYAPCSPSPLAWPPFCAAGAIATAPFWVLGGAPPYYYIPAAAYYYPPLPPPAYYPPPPVPVEYHPPQPVASPAPPPPVYYTPRG